MPSITVFEVAPAADGPFVAGWERARAHADGAVLYRALRDDADFRFVELAADGIAGLSGVDPRIAVHAARYEVVHEDGDVDGAGGVLLVAPFEVPPEDDERFLAAWEPGRAANATRRGYLGTRLHRAAGAADLRWVELARWSSPLMVARASREPGPAAPPFAAHPALYVAVGA